MSVFVRVPRLSQAVTVVFHVYRGHIILWRFQAAVVLWQDLYLPFLFLLLLSRRVFSRRFWGSSPRRQRYAWAREISDYTNDSPSYEWINPCWVSLHAWCGVHHSSKDTIRHGWFTFHCHNRCILLWQQTFMHCCCSKTMKLTFVCFQYHANKYCCFLS